MDAVQIDAARQHLTDIGFPGLAKQINGDALGIIRPCRPLTADEALAMVRCWKHATVDRPICDCPEDDDELLCPFQSDDGTFECRPDWDNEQVIAQRMASLTRPIGAHFHSRGEVCTWPDSWVLRPNQGPRS